MARRKGKERLLTEQIEELGRLEKGAGTLGKQLDTIYSDLANNLQRVQQSTEKQKSSFQDQVDIGKKLLGNAKNIFGYSIPSFITGIFSNCISVVPFNLIQAFQPYFLERFDIALQSFTSKDKNFGRSL